MEGRAEGVWGGARDVGGRGSRVGWHDWSSSWFLQQGGSHCPKPCKVCLLLYCEFTKTERRVQVVFACRSPIVYTRFADLQTPTAVPGIMID